MSLIGTFTIMVNGEPIILRDLHRSFDSTQTYQVPSVNYDITATETKPIRTISRKSFIEDLPTIKLRSGRTLTCTADHKLPVLRITVNGPTMIVLRADQLVLGDALYFIKDNSVNIDLISILGMTDFSGSVFSLELITNDQEHDDQYIISADTGIVLHV